MSRFGPYSLGQGSWEFVKQLAAVCDAGTYLSIYVFDQNRASLISYASLEERIGNDNLFRKYGNWLMGC
jgi:hypothetical protein